MAQQDGAIGDAMGHIQNSNRGRCRCAGVSGLVAVAVVRRAAALGAHHARADGVLGTPVIYPLSVMQQSHEKYMWLIIANPLTSIIETFKYGFLGEGIFSWWYLGYSFLFTVLIVVWGMITFNKVQRSFMDVI